MSTLTKEAIDAEIVAFENALMRSLDQASRGEGRVSTAEQIASRRAHPFGSVKPRQLNNN